MSRFKLFDSVKLKEAISLEDGFAAPAGTSGAIVEVFNDGEAYLVELFGDWVKSDDQGNFVKSDRNDSQAFCKTIGVETVYPHQISLSKPLLENLFVLLEELPDDSLKRVQEFVESLQPSRSIQR